MVVIHGDEILNGGDKPLVVFVHPSEIQTMVKSTGSMTYGCLAEFPDSMALDQANEHIQQLTQTVFNVKPEKLEYNILDKEEVHAND